MLSPVKIGLHIRQLREAHNYSQEHMADILNMSQSAYANIENGKVHIRVDRLYEIATVLNVPPLQLITESTEDSTSKASSNGNVDTASGYNELIVELRSEIAFLRHIVELQEKRK